MTKHLIIVMLILLMLTGCSTQSVTPTLTSGDAAGGLTPRPTIVTGESAATARPNAPAPTLPAAPTNAPTQVPVLPTSAPTQAPAPPTTAPASDDVITLIAPASGTTVQSPVRITGNATFSPFEMNFGVSVYDSEGNILGQTGITGVGEYGKPSTFDGEIEWTAPASTRPGKIVVFESSAKDGSILTQTEVKVQLAGVAAGSEHIALPAENASVTLPLHVEVANVGPKSSYGLRLVYADGTVLAGDLNTPSNAVSPTAAATNLQWATESAPPNPPSQPARLEVLTRTGDVVATQNIYVLNHADENVMPIKVFFALGEEVREVTRYVPRSQSVATAALRELSWGPAGNELAAAGFISALPVPAEIADYANFQPDWTSRVFLQSIRIENGVAFVDWSREMAAWGGGSARLGTMYDQVTRTLTQFPTIKSVEMTVDGSAEVLQP